MRSFRHFDQRYLKPATDAVLFADRGLARRSNRANLVDKSYGLSLAKPDPAADVAATVTAGAAPIFGRVPPENTVIGALN
jgi:hypothetical protein